MKAADAMFSRYADRVVCRVCGALVGDERTHKQWHQGKR